MFKGFYNLTSGMLTQGRKLDVLSNNMTNISTAGYKSDQYTARTFEDAIISRVGNKDKGNPVELGSQSYMLVSDELYTDYTQGLLEETGITLNFAIDGDGFFAVRDPNGGVAYTRSGDFSLDEEGYLCLSGIGQVLDPQEQPIHLMTDKITSDDYGGLYTQGGALLGQLGVFAVEDTGQLERNPFGLFLGDGQAVQNGDATVKWKYLERANVDLVRQMTEMISTQRALQSAAQVSKMYDEVMTKASTSLGQI